MMQHKYFLVVHDPYVVIWIIFRQLVYRTYPLMISRCAIVQPWQCIYESWMGSKGYFVSCCFAKRCNNDTAVGAMLGVGYLRCVTVRTLPADGLLRLCRIHPAMPQLSPFGSKGYSYSSWNSIFFSKWDTNFHNFLQSNFDYHNFPLF